mmetsp:Transcript_11386/g.20214  ORF Transcript_11386/g.20214 Transcript_11386/m.20214 type:complete len:375 (-) Transcript_11386:9-1133(-)
MKPPSHIGILLAIIFTICISDLVFVWRTVELELEDNIQRQHYNPNNRNGQQPLQQQQQQLPPSTNSSVIDPEKLHAYQILLDAGVSPITPSILSQLPRWSDIVSQYGPKPLLHNLESSCPAFRASVPKQDRFAAVAGLFNTGTNLLGNLMTQNCQIDGRSKGTGMRSQVPWGKHNPPSTHRLKNVAKVGGMGINQTAVFPLVLIKDPYHWAGSQCRHRYFTAWEQDSEHCPNIVSWTNGSPTQVSVGYALGVVEYKTLIGQWNSWYNEYEEQVFPLATLRFEDILFHAEEVVTTLCKCVEGRRRRGKFKYPEESAKHGLVGHTESNGLMNALIRYGDPGKRLEGWTERDWEYASVHLDRGLVDKYGYSRPEWTS